LAPRGQSERVDYLIAGLGNPGSEYARNRHNVGCLVVDELARRHRYARAKRGYKGRYGAGTIAGRPVGMLVPTTFMNNAGASVAAALRGSRLEPDRLLVIHDEIDLPFGELRLRFDGGHGGHNGVRSVVGLVGSDFHRLRVGVGRPDIRDPDVVADWVLHDFAEPRDEVDVLVGRAADAAAVWVERGIQAAMNEFNGGGGPAVD
jgi:PTH1 family peptidyl-tRNA hydrolase